MLSALRDLPDWMTGTAIASGLWFGTVYTVLTPRALEAEIENQIMPQCMAQLEQEQSLFLTNFTRDKKLERENKVESARRKIRTKEREINELQSNLAAYRVLEGFYDGPIGQIIPMPDFPKPSQKDIEAAKAQLLQAKKLLTDLPPITFPPAPRGEMITFCGCAALTSMAGKRTDYTISLASFRLITPESVSNKRSDISQALQWNGCGQKPWENYS